MSRRLTLLGATGSIGKSTLDIVRHHPERFDVWAMSANERVAEMAALVLEFKPSVVVMGSENSASALVDLLPKEMCTQVLWGPHALEDIASASEVDTVVAAIVGAVGLKPTMAAVCSGKRILLANKESLVMAGGLFIEAVKAHHACLLPVDSEHNAMFQCLPAVSTGVNTLPLHRLGVRKLILTGSGGPFRQAPLEELDRVTPEAACAHPNWSMGPKISVDSATMMNKGLEFIEACWLFGAKPGDIQVVVHPQSIVHSMVEYVDGSVLAQLGQPDMRTPIAHCLGWPERIEAPVKSLDFWRLGSLDFMPPDEQRFPLLSLAMSAMQVGGTAPTVLNAANEVAVAAFLEGRLAFTRIASLVDETLQKLEICEPRDLNEVIQADGEARRFAAEFLQSPPFFVNTL